MFSARFDPGRPEHTIHTARSGGSLPAGKKLPSMTMTSFPWASGAWHSSLPSSSRRKVGSDLLWLLNLRRIDIIVPMLVVADRHLRFPGRGAWFQYHRDQMLGPPGRAWISWYSVDSVARYTPSR